MNILAVSYHNIGPFVGKKISLCFQHQHVLIHGPIGTGKSFLFFDGVLYGLYRPKENRKILNLQSQTGYIKLCIEVDGMILLITRQLKSSKNNSCVSALYRIDADIESVQALLYQTLGQTLTQDTDIQPILQQLPIDLVNFKNETDLQQHIQALIGSSDVLQYTNFLVQDSGNIFTESKSERINLLKQIFQLTAIDHAKDTLAEERYRLNALKNIKSDTQVMIEAYQTLQTKLATQIPLLGQIPGLSSVEIDLHRLCGSSIEYALIDTQTSTILQSKEEALQSDIHHYENLKKEDAQLSTTLQHIHHQGKLYDQQITDLNKEKTMLMQDQIPEDESALQQALGQLQHYAENLQDLTQSCRLDVLQVEDPSIQTLLQADHFIRTLITEGKQGAQEIIKLQSLMQNLQDQKDLNQKEIQNLHKQLEIDISNPLVIKELTQHRNYFQQEINLIDQALTHHQQNYAQYLQQTQDIQANIDKLQTVLDQKSDFFCNHIQGQCPFITTINETSLKPLILQIQSLTSQKQDLQLHWDQQGQDHQHKHYLQAKKVLEEKIQDTFNHPQAYLGDYIEQIQARITSLEQHTQIQDLDHTIQVYQSQIDSIKQRNIDIKKILTESDYQSIQSSYQQFLHIQDQYHILQQDIQKLQLQKQKLIQYQQDIQNKEIQIASIHGQIAQLQIQKNTIQEQSQTIKQELSTYDIQQLQTWAQGLHTISHHVLKIGETILDYKKSQSDLIQIKQDLEYINNLHQIFAKDLLLIVLQEILPLVTTILNQLLAVVVSYEITIDITNPSPDKLELEAIVRDEYGTRSVDSLSGGQKAILKLVWILAVSIYLQVKFIFLDETINNLDPDTIAKVAQLLEDYVKKNNIKLHIITHSPQIKEMNIRDDIIDLSTLQSA